MSGSDRFLEVHPSGPVRGSVRVPASKSLTNRALVLAALARGRSRIQDPLVSDDTSRLVAALRALGVVIAGSGSDERLLEIQGRDGVFTSAAGSLDVGGSGTAMRFLTALAALVPGETVINGDARLRERPVGPLLEALRGLGVDARSIAENGRPPVRVRGGPLGGGTVRLPGDVSSQFVSALLMVAPFADAPVVLEIDPPVVSRPYLALTTSLMERFGVRPPTPQPLADGGLRYEIPSCAGSPPHDASCVGRTGAASRAADGRAVYRATTYRVPPDASSAAYFFAAAVVTKGRVRVEGVDPDDGQADAALLRILPELGCEVTRDAEGTTVAGPPSGRIASFDLDGADCPDLVPMLAVLALFAEGPCVIRGAGNLRLKESDRLAALAAEIRRLGAVADERPDGLRIVPGTLRGDRIATYDDHRIAMAFAIAGLAIPGVRIENPDCVAKSFPGFWTTLERLTS